MHNSHLYGGQKAINQLGYSGKRNLTQACQNFKVWFWPKRIVAMEIKLLKRRLRSPRLRLEGWGQGWGQEKGDQETCDADFCFCCKTFKSTGKARWKKVLYLSKAFNLSHAQMHALTHTRTPTHSHTHTHTHPFMGTTQGVSLPLKLNKCYRHLTPDDNPESDRTRNNERVATDQNLTRIQIKGESTKKRPRDKIILPAADTKVA